MNAKIHIGPARADTLYRFILGLLVLMAFCVQQVVLAQSDTAAGEQHLLATADAPAKPSDPTEAGVYAGKSALWWRLLEQQFAFSLDAPIENIREGTLRNVIFFANVYGDRVQLRKIVPQLVGIYATEKNEAYRMMALAALHAIDDPYGMRALAELVQHERPGRLRQCTLAALVDHLEKRRQNR